MDGEETQPATEDKELHGNVADLMTNLMEQIETHELISRRLKGLNAPDIDADSKEMFEDVPEAECMRQLDLSTFSCPTFPEGQLGRWWTEFRGTKETTNKEAEAK